MTTKSPFTAEQIVEIKRREILPTDTGSLVHDVPAAIRSGSESDWNRVFIERARQSNWDFTYLGAEDGYAWAISPSGVRKKIPARSVTSGVIDSRWLGQTTDPGSLATDADFKGDFRALCMALFRVKYWL